MINFHFFFQNTDKSSLEELEGKENCFNMELNSESESVSFLKKYPGDQNKWW